MHEFKWIVLAALIGSGNVGCDPKGSGSSGGGSSTTSSTTDSTSTGGTGGTTASGGTGGTTASGGVGGTGGTTTSGGTGGVWASGGTGGVGGMADVCGDSVVTPPEACDDGNALGGDGCSAACMVEEGFLCSGSPSVCVPAMCDGVALWQGADNTFPTCFAYLVSANHDANNCEFYVDAFGRGSYSVNGFSGSWLEADLRTSAAIQGQVQNAGMLVRYLDEANVQKTGWRLGSEASPGIWHTGFTWTKTGPGMGNFTFQVVDFAFFIDVKGAGGDVTRLWISKSGANYTVAETYAVPGTIQSGGSTTIEFAADAASLFDQKHACVP